VPAAADVAGTTSAETADPGTGSGTPAASRLRPSHGLRPRRSVRLANGAQQFAGMSHPRDWGKTLAHEHTRSYGCQWCGVRFRGEGGPQAFYRHLEKRHRR
jgi:hypothetical protein